MTHRAGRFSRFIASGSLSLGLLFSLLFALIAPPPSFAQSVLCATSGKDGAGGTLAGIKNAYYPGTASAAAGATSITLGTATGASTQITSGDLLLVIQMQDASIDFTNSANYGDGAGGNGGFGYTNANGAGRYEFVKALNTVALTGGTLNLLGAGTGNGLVNSYTNADATSSQGQRRFQVIRVPQYSSATLGSTLTALAWNGTTGGVLSIDVAGSLALGNATVSVSGLGFRGAGGRQLLDAGGTLADTDYVTLSTIDANGGKAEGIAGTPRFVYNSATNAVVDLTTEGYPGGSYARGGPGNAGGGGTDGNPTVNDQNTGGGGGGNAGAGGKGGNAWNSQDATGGFGGAAFAERSNSRVVMGGGGGAGSRNNDPTVPVASSGAAGGGIVIIRAGQLTGTGTINANGAAAFNDTENDGGGGGGAGGSILVWVLGGGLGNLTVNAAGGRGGDAWRTQDPNGNPGERHGPGGGGGGGFIRTSANVAGGSVAGGAHGITTTSNTTYGSVNGNAGSRATGLTSASIPGIKSGAECAGVTEVTMDSFEATSYDKGTLLQWSTGYEVDNLGFNIYREVQGKRTQINSSLLAGSALTIGAGTQLTAGHSYQWLDPDAKPGEFVQYWIEDIGLNGEITVHGPVAPHGVGGKLPKFARALALSELGSGSGDAALRQVWNDETQSESSDRFSAMAVQAKGGNLQTQWEIAARPGLKLGIKKDGWYRVTQQELITAGFKPSGDPRFLQLFVDGREVPLKVNVGASGKLGFPDSIEFYGTALDEAYTGTHAYYLSYGQQPGLRLETVPGYAGIAASTSSFPLTVELRERTIFFASLKNGDSPNWFGSVLTSQPVSKTLRAANVAKGVVVSGDQSSVEVAVQGVSTDPGSPVTHSVSVMLNGLQLGTMDFRGMEHPVVRFPIPAELVNEGDNIVTLQALNGGMDVNLIDYIRLTYNHSFTADSNLLRYRAAGFEKIKIDGFSRNSVRVFDIADSYLVRELTGTVNAEPSGFSVTVAASVGGQRNLLAFSDDQVLHPASITANEPSSWNRTGQAADIVIVSHKNFIKSLEPLVAFRKQQKYDVALIDVEDLYDEFNYGARSPYAIKDFLLRSTTVWKKAPRFLLLVGDSTIDPRDYLGRGDLDFVPTKFVESALLEAASDDWYGDFDGTGLTSIAIGRLPVHTTQDADNIVAKILRAEQTIRSMDALMVADRNDGFDFEGTEGAVKALMPPGTQVQEVLRSKSDDATAKSTIISTFNRGPRIVNYNGHGSSMLWRGNLLTNADAARLTNFAAPSLVVSMTCLNGLFVDPNADSLGEALMKATNGGAYAVWASSGLREPLGQSVVNQELYRYLFTPGVTLGEAIRKAKESVSDPDIRYTWILFGDPASRMR